MTPAPAHRRRRCLAAALIAAAWALPPAWAGSFRTAVETIRAEGLRRHCAVLASDTLEGRETGTRGGQAAGAYIVAELRKLHARPGGIDGDYVQPFSPDGRNILALLPGSDPELRRDYIVIGAHYDHVGYGNARNSLGPIGQIHNGADDNASGTSALLELVAAFGSLDRAPRRSLLFAFWDGEEKGLLGSQYWVSSPTAPLERVRLAFNIDMIGRLRDNRVEVYGCRSACGLRHLLCDQNVENPLSCVFAWETRSDSDHYSFFARRIPYLMVFSGNHEDYHRPSDDVERLNVVGAERITRLLFRTAHAAAEAPSLPGFRAAALNEGEQSRRAAEEAAAPPPRLGIAWDPQLAAASVIRVTQIDPGSPAAAAGLRVGDRIRAFDGRAIERADDLRAAVRAAGSRTRIVVERDGAGERSFDVALADSPDRAGLWWRSDEAEPDTPVITRVLPDSPAARAGLQPGDRVESVHSASGGPVELAEMLRAPSGAFQLNVERLGRHHSARISLDERPRGRKPAAASRP
jgi:hypothetical protein